MLLYSHRPTAPSYALAESPRNYPSGRPRRCGAAHDKLRTLLAASGNYSLGSIRHLVVCTFLAIGYALAESPRNCPNGRPRRCGAAHDKPRTLLAASGDYSLRSFFILHVRTAPSSRANGLSSQKCQDLSCRATYRFHLGRACDIMYKSTQSMTAGAWKCLEQI